jgi:hypothetical protein
MLRYLVQVVQNLLTTGILVALLFAAREGEDQKGKKWALWGCGGGAAAALVISVLLRTTALIHRGFFNTWTLFFAVLFGILHILLQWKIWKLNFLRKSPGLKAAFPVYIQTLLLGVLLLYALPAIFLYPSEFVLAGQSVISTDFLFKFIGYAAGLTVVCIVSFALYKTAGALSAPLVRVFLTIALVINMGSQIIAIVQFLLARRIIPMIRWLFRFIIVAVNANMGFLYALRSEERRVGKECSLACSSRGGAGA